MNVNNTVHYGSTTTTNIRSNNANAIVNEREAAHNPSANLDINNGHQAVINTAEKNLHLMLELDEQIVKAQRNNDTQELSKLQDMRNKVMQDLRGDLTELHHIVPETEYQRLSPELRTAINEYLVNDETTHMRALLRSATFAAPSPVGAAAGDTHAEDAANHIVTDNSDFNGSSLIKQALASGDPLLLIAIIVMIAALYQESVMKKFASMQDKQRAQSSNLGKVSAIFTDVKGMFLLLTPEVLVKLFGDDAKKPHSLAELIAAVYDQKMAEDDSIKGLKGKLGPMIDEINKFVGGKAPIDPTTQDANTIKQGLDNFIQSANAACGDDTIPTDIFVDVTSLEGGAESKIGDVTKSLDNSIQSLNSVSTETQTQLNSTSTIYKQLLDLNASAIGKYAAIGQRQTQG